MFSQFNTSTHARSGLKSALGIGLLSFMASGTALGLSYTVTDLGTLGGATSHARRINEQGQVVGNSFTVGWGIGGDMRAFLWTPGRGIEDLGTLGGAESGYPSINNSGQVVGRSERPSNQGVHAFLWTRSGGMQDLGSLFGASTWSEANGINDKGEVVGRSDTPDNIRHAFLWTPTRGMEDLGGGDAGGINNNTVITIGGSFIWTRSGGVQDMGSLGGDETESSDINDNGQVVGGSIPAGGVSDDDYHAFLWSQNGGMQDLGTLGRSPSEAWGINNKGVVVGSSNTPGGARHAFLWTTTLGMTDLNNADGVSGSGWLLEDAWDINNAGQIAGNGRNPSGQYHAFLLTPTDPFPNVKANQSDGPINVAPTATLSLTVQLTAGNQANADWWLVAHTPSGDWYYYVYPNQWVLAGVSLGNVSFAYQGPLFNVNPFQALTATGLVPGTYHVYFGVDLNMNGLLDMDQVFYDKVDVIVQ